MAPSPSKLAPEREYVNQPTIRPRDVHNPRYQSDIDPVMDDDYLTPDPTNDTRESNYSDMDGGGYLDPLISKSGVRDHPRAWGRYLSWHMRVIVRPYLTVTWLSSFTGYLQCNWNLERCWIQFLLLFCVNELFFIHEGVRPFPVFDYKTECNFMT